MEHTYFVAEFSEAYSEPSRTAKIEHFAEIVNSVGPLSSFAENAFLDV